MPSPSKEEALRCTDIPPEYKEYLARESEILGSCLDHSWDVLEVGCGEGRVLDLVARRVRSFTGIDVDPSLVASANERLLPPGTRVIELDAHKLLSHFGAKAFDSSIGCWNTIGNITEDEQDVLRQMGRVSRELVYIGVIAKGALDIRRAYYQGFGEDDLRIEPDSETIYSSLWGISRAYSKDELNEMAGRADLKVELIETAGGVAHCCLLRPR